MLCSSYDLLSKKQAELERKNYQLIIMDESHCIKNDKSARTRAAEPLMKVLLTEKHIIPKYPHFLEGKHYLLVVDFAQIKYTIWKTVKKHMLSERYLTLDSKVLFDTVAPLTCFLKVYLLRNSAIFYHSVAPLARCTAIGWRDLGLLWRQVRSCVRLDFDREPPKIQPRVEGSSSCTQLLQIVNISKTQSLWIVFDEIVEDLTQSGSPVMEDQTQ
jgi:hypothetical protein